MLSFARGGLAEAWTGGCYEFSENDLRDFPFGFDELRPYYDDVSRHIGISGQHDDIARFSPFTASYLAPLPLDAHSDRLLKRYQERRTRLNRLGFYLGRSRVATLTRDAGERQACGNLGRCLWGCPRQALYAPSMTLRQCLRHERFRYVPGHVVSHFRYDSRGQVTAIVAQPVDGGAEVELAAAVVVLAAGALGSSRIYLESLYRQEKRLVALDGLMDNPHAVIPFVNLRHLGQPVRTDSYQFHLLALEMEASDGRHEAHGQITTLRAASVHPIVQNLPFDLKTSAAVFARIRSALGVANVWRPGMRRGDHTITLRPDGSGGVSLVVECTPDASSLEQLSAVMSRVRRGLAELGCVAPAAMSQVLPLGSSVHYAGTLPMTLEEREHTCDRDGRVRGFRNLMVADGASFPSLPASNLTFTLMANAARVAARLDAIPVAGRPKGARAPGVGAPGTPG
jgi:choline dehydrogenase-like flavoprotein